jgi:phosphate transport system permease protein
MKSSNIRSRQRTANLGRASMFLSLIFALLALCALLLNVANRTFGYVAVQRAVNPDTFADKPISQMSRDELIDLLIKKAQEGEIDGLSMGVLRRMESEKSFSERTRDEVYAVVNERIIKQEIVRAWTLGESIWGRGQIEAELNDINTSKAKDRPNAMLEFKSWVNPNFLVTPMSSIPELAGIRTAILGSLIVVVLAMLIAMPVGVGAAIYLEEYAGKSKLNQIIQVNINNLAGVPSIIYGMVGLFVFVRAFESLTSGAVFGIQGNNGRTVISAAMTMALLVLPLIIINAQEAVRAVPNSLRQASYGVGATKWETIRDHVLPSAAPGIMTGAILAMSRAMGETAPMIVIGASTFIVTDPTGPFSKFTTLPIQIYNWTAQPAAEFRNIAAAAIIVLLVILISLNLTAIVLRNKSRAK